MSLLSALATSFGLGFLYFISAIPAGLLAGAPLWAVTLFAWAGYCAGGGVVLLAGVPLRAWLLRKLRFSPQPDQTRFFWRIWLRYGIFGLGLVAPVTIGPQVSVLLALTLGVPTPRIFWAVSLGAIPWALGFAMVAGLGRHLIS